MTVFPFLFMLEKKGTNDDVKASKKRLEKKYLSQVGTTCEILKRRVTFEKIEIVMES